MRGFRTRGTAAASRWLSLCPSHVVLGGGGRWRDRGRSSKCQDDAIVVEASLLSLAWPRWHVPAANRKQHLYPGWAGGSSSELCVPERGPWPRHTAPCPRELVSRGAGAGDTGQQAELRGIKTAISMKEEINGAVTTGQWPDCKEVRSHRWTLGQRAREGRPSGKSSHYLIRRK